MGGSTHLLGDDGLGALGGLRIIGERYHGQPAGGETQVGRGVGIRIGSRIRIG